MGWPIMRRALPPLPMASKARPPVTSYNVDIAVAVTAGWRRNGVVTIGVRVAFLLSCAATVSDTYSSWARAGVSPTPMTSYPRSSARRTRLRKVDSSAPHSMIAPSFTNRLPMPWLHRVGPFEDNHLICRAQYGSRCYRVPLDCATCDTRKCSSSVAPTPKAHCHCLAVSGLPPRGSVPKARFGRRGLGDGAARVRRHGPAARSGGTVRRHASTGARPRPHPSPRHWLTSVARLLTLRAKAGARRPAYLSLRRSAMDIGVCLPTTMPGADGSQLIEFARRADRLGFHSLTVVDRVVYDNYDGIVALSAAAAVTERIQLVTAILLAAYRPSSVELAKQLASLDRLSGGRLIVGVSAGMREDDYTATGTDYGTRGKRLDSTIEEIRAVWQGQGPTPGVGPRPTNADIPIWVGGHSPAGLRRAAKYGIGWISPGGPPHKYPELVTKVKELWAEEGRTGSPRMGANCYVSLGPRS